MDPAKCLEILGSRGTCGESHDGAHGAHTVCTNGHEASTEPTPSQASAEAAATAVRGGQVLNLATGTNETVAAARAVSSLISASAQVAPSATSQGAPYSGDQGDGTEQGGGATRVSTATAVGEAGAGDDCTEREKAAAIGGVEGGGVVRGLEGMSAASLVVSFRRAQEERVALYRKFNGGLKEALRNGDYSGYPALCCEVTAAFSVLSKAINSMEALLAAKPETKTLAGIIRQVQGYEKELLTLTAAHHLESMREARALGMGPGMSAHSGGGGAGPTSSGQDRLLKEGVQELLKRAEGEAASVTELLEELRYEAEGLS